MPGTDQVKGIVRPDRRFKGFHLESQPCLGQQNVNFQHGFVTVLELRLNGGDLPRKCHKDPLDLLCFLCAVLQNAGVGFHNGLRLDKYGRAGGRHIVDDAAHFAAVLALDRNNVPAVAHGDDALLQILGGVHIPDHAFQAVADAVFGGADLFAQIVQRVRCRICHGIRRKDRAGDLLFQTGLWSQCVKQIIRRQYIVVGRAVPAAQILKIAQCAGDHQQFAHREHAALDGTGGQLADPFDAAEPWGAILDQQRVDGVRLFQCVPDFIRITLGFQPEQHLFCFLAHTALRCARNDLIQFERS